MSLGVLWAALKLLRESLKIEFQVDFDLQLPGCLWVFDVFTVSKDTQAALGSSEANPPFPDALVRDVDHDLVDNCCDEGLGITVCGIGTREEAG